MRDILDIEIGPAHLLLIAVVMIVGFPLIFELISSTSLTLNQTASVLNRTIGSLPSTNDTQTSSLLSLTRTMLAAAQKLLSLLTSREAVAAMIAAGIVIAAIVMRTG